MLKNKKHAAFVDNYFFNNFNATRAYMETYGIENARAASVSACNLLKNTRVNKEIEDRISSGNYLFKNKRYKSITNNVYLMQEDALGLCKLGIASNPMNRLSNLQVACPQNITLLGVLKVENAKMYEAELHARYHIKHYRGEWFRLLDSDIDDLLAEWSNLEEIAKKNNAVPNPSVQLILIHE